MWGGVRVGVGDGYRGGGGDVDSLNSGVVWRVESFLWKC